LAAEQAGRVEPLSSIRQRIAEHMLRSRRTSAHVFSAMDIDMEAVEQVRRRHKDSFRDREGYSLTYLPFIARAIVDALTTHPAVNASIDVEAKTVTFHDYVNLGIAVDLEEKGLIVPVVKRADEMTVNGLARRIRELAEKARSRTLTPDDVVGSTYTITNPGPFGSLMSAPVINQPNVAIMSTEAVEKRVVVVDDMIAIRHRMYLCMSWDHRAFDGSTAVKFLASVKSNLETWDWEAQLS
jgi:2-oxoglutarate dehydrogenase E2 component (dihydrolipoamide succinyltransferase)